jgi:hypothetical protein
MKELRPYHAIRVDLPLFAIFTLRRRAREQSKTLSVVVEALILDSIMLDEVQAMIQETPGFARVFERWLQYDRPEVEATFPAGWRERLRQAIRESGKKQSVIAYEAGMTPETVSRILSAQHARPSFESIAKIARAAGVSLGWIMEEPGFSLTDEQRAKVRTAGVLLLNLTGGLPKS